MSSPSKSTQTPQIEVQDAVAQVQVGEEAPPAYDAAPSTKVDLGLKNGAIASEENMPLLRVGEGLNTVIVTAQPVARGAMIISPPNPKNLALDENGRRAFSHDLLDCGADLPFCCYATWCQPCAYGNVKSRLNWLDASGNPHPTGGRSLGSDCALHLLCTFTFGSIGGRALQALNRNSIRSRYAIRGNPILDCFASLFCSPCHLTQEHRELQAEEQEILGTGNGVIRLPGPDELV